ncbi:MAG TPA: chemotaxis-specific protein-glutamate methyltransferase CheB [Sphingomonas sp.]
MAVPFSYERKAGGAAPIRLMVVDDSIVARSVFETMLAPLDDFRVVATASTADQAFARLDETPVDIVLLDLAMPGMDGLTALPEIIRRGAGARVLIVSASAAEGASACVRALTLGAADTLEKPRAGAFGEPFRADLVEKLRRIGGEARPPAGVGPPAGAAPVPAVVHALSPRVVGPVSCVAIGASTGGLHALSAFFRRLPDLCDAPILITQHLPASFMPYFAAQMTDITGRPAEVARDGVALRPGGILVAPGDGHIRLRAYGASVSVEIDRAPAPSGCLPSVDPMFESVAAFYGKRAFAVVLTGMGRDGLIGARHIVDAGGEVAVQDRATSVVWGMPGSVAHSALAATIAPPEALAARLAERVAQSITARRAHGAAWR